MIPIVITHPQPLILTAIYVFTDTGEWALGVYTDEAEDKLAAYEAAEQTRNQEGF